MNKFNKLKPDDFIGFFYVKILGKKKVPFFNETFLYFLERIISLSQPEYPLL